MKAALVFLAFMLSRSNILFYFFAIVKIIMFHNENWTNIVALKDF